MRIRLLAILLLLIPALAYPQTGISPLIVEAKASKAGKASGEFLVTNSSIQPASVVLEPKSFSAIDGHFEVRPLDPLIHLKLSETSARIPPKSSHTFFWNVQCDLLPCFFQIYSASTNARQVQSGIVVRIVLSEAVYVCRKSKGCRESVHSDVFHITPVSK